MKWRKEEGGFVSTFLAPLAVSLVQRVISLVVEGISGKGARRAGKRYMNRKVYFRFILLAISRISAFCEEIIYL